MMDVTSITLALRTLGSFDFEGQTDKIIFIPNSFSWGKLNKTLCKKDPP